MKAQQLIATLRARGYEPFAYSGRGMYGDYCVAVQSDTYPPIDGASSDSLGKSTVWYWPSAKAPDDLD